MISVRNVGVGPWDNRPSDLTLQHVAIETRPEDTDACVEFWALLGFERVDAPASLAHRATWLQHDRLQVHLLLADDPQVPPEGHVAVVVDDYEQTLKALSEAGYEPRPSREHWGQPRAFVRDPGGHRVEIMAAPPPPAPPRAEY